MHHLLLVVTGSNKRGPAEPRHGHWRDWIETRCVAPPKLFRPLIVPAHVDLEHPLKRSPLGPSTVKGMTKFLLERGTVGGQPSADIRRPSGYTFSGHPPPGFQPMNMPQLLYRTNHWTHTHNSVNCLTPYTSDGERLASALQVCLDLTELGDGQR